MMGEFLLQPHCQCQLRFISCFAFDVTDDVPKPAADGLRLHVDTIGSGAMQLLCGIFKYNNVVERLDLSGKGVETDAAHVLATAVRHNRTLKSIDLSGNPISDVTLYTRPR